MTSENSAAHIHTVIAIDGPAASGKSTVARELARRLGYAYVNTGAMYRAATWVALRAGADLCDPAAVLRALDASGIAFGMNDRVSTIRIGGLDPSPELGTPAVNAAVSAVSAHPTVRERLVARQRAYADEADLVVEGRDIGSVVFPETPYKFYVDASLEVRARRRAAQGLLDEIGARDHTDSQRKASPLIIAEDAHVVDSSSLTVDGVVGEIIGRLKLRGLAISPVAKP